MLFNSYLYLLCFLPIAWLAAAGLETRGQNFRSGSPWALLSLVIASCIFYAAWKVAFLPLLLLSILANYLLGMRVAQSRGALLLGLIFNLALLASFKYADFFINNLNALLGSSWPLTHWLLPLGISFFTFTQITYLVDVRRGEPPARGLLEYALFVSWFPHLLAGPILHHRAMLPQFRDVTRRLADSPQVAAGLTLLTLGLAKKVLLADTLAPWADAGFAATGGLAATDAWLAVLCYTLQIYFDFSGYTDMALGASQLFGIRLPINFASPYQARNLAEFWRRWHISLSNFLRDYLYAPLGGNRRGFARGLSALLLTFVLGGLWHGANWTFVVWGLLNGLGVLMVRVWDRAALARRLSFPGPVAWALTFVYVMLGWVFFRSANLAQAADMLSAMRGGGAAASLVPLPWHDLTQQSGLSYWKALWTAAVGVLALALALTAPNTQTLLARWRYTSARACGLALLAILCFVQIGSVREFLYFNF